MYVTGYDKHLHIPLWVAYRLDGKNLDNPLSRKNSFRPDPRLGPSDSAQCEDYHYSGFDRGHLAPNGDMNYNYATMAQTFYLSNVAPQYHQFNGGVWEYAEELTRSLAKLYGTVYVISGSIFDVNNDGLEDSTQEPKCWLHNRTGSAAIPTDFFKIIVRCDGGQFIVTHSQDAKNSDASVCSGQLQLMSFVLPHTNEVISKDDYSAYILNHVVSVRDIVLLSGFDFFPSLSDSEKASLQSVVPMSLWPALY
jgi:DNA/RNA endonuclease G (NUC1)